MLHHRRVLPTPAPTPTHGNTNREEQARMCRVAAAVAMVERSIDSRGNHKVSVRRAADYFDVPKSTVHRHLQANRSARSAQRQKKSKYDISYITNRHDVVHPRFLPPLRPTDYIDMWRENTFFEKEKKCKANTPIFSLHFCALLPMFSCSVLYCSVLYSTSVRIIRLPRQFWKIDTSIRVRAYTSLAAPLIGPMFHDRSRHSIVPRA